MPVEWSENLRTGIPIIDKQHKYLIVMLARFGRIRCSRECFHEAYNELKEFVNKHFEVERKLMITTNYPDFESHKAQHDKFSEQLRIFDEKVDKEEDFLKLGAEFYDFAIDWMVVHYSNDDIALAKYVKRTRNIN